MYKTSLSNMCLGLYHRTSFSMLHKASAVALGYTNTRSMCHVQHQYFSQNLLKVKEGSAWQPLKFQPSNCRILSTRPPTIDPNRESRRHKLTLATYLSGFIGIFLLSAVGLRFYSRAKLKAGGIEEVKLAEYSHGRRPHLYKYRGYCLPQFIVTNLRSIHTFDVREDDVWVISFPKAGTTWLEEIVYLVMNDTDREKALSRNIDERVPYFEYPTPGLDAISAVPSPRIIKSHLPFSLLPNQMKQKKPKIIYIARNPKDTVVSFYWFSIKFLSMIPFNGTFEDYAKLFAADKVAYGPWWQHVSEAWNMRDEDNIHVVFYEDLHSNPHEAVQEIAEFLGKPLSDKQVAEIVEHTSFESMQRNSSSNYEWLKDAGLANKDARFMRKGQVGDWKNHLSPEIVKELDEMAASKLPSDIVIRDTLDK